MRSTHTIVAALAVCLLSACGDIEDLDNEFTGEAPTVDETEDSKSDRARLARRRSSIPKGNAQFARKLANPAGFLFDIGAEAICGISDDLQHVERYDGRYTNLGFSNGFVGARQRAVGALAATNRDGSTSKFCSGTLIDQNLFLTASHCIDRNIRRRVVVFNFQNDPSGNPRREIRRRVLEVVEDGARMAGVLDYAILRIERRRGDRFGVTRLGRGAPRAAAIIQHPSGEPKQVDAGRQIRSFPGFLGYRDIDTEPGSSGSGVLGNDGRLYAVHVQGHCDNPLRMNLGVPVDLIVAHSTLLATIACGTEWVTSAAQCGYETVTSVAQCGADLVTSAAECGTELVTSAAECGQKWVEDAVACGSETVVSAAECGTELLSVLSPAGLQAALQRGLDCVGSLFTGNLRCEFPRECQIPLECWVPETCEIAATCEVPNTCQIEATCEVPDC